MSTETLDRQQIIKAAIELLDTEGLEGLSMRRLGGRLGAGATSIYWYVKSKDELFALAADEVFGEIDLPDPGGEAGWRAAAGAMAHGLRAAILRHPWLAPVFGSHPVYGPKIARWVNHSLTIFQTAGFTGPRLDRAGDTLFAWVLGVTLGEAALRAQLHREGVRADAYVAELTARALATAQEFPLLRERLDAQQHEDHDATSEDTFEFGLRTVLDGLAARLGDGRDNAGQG